MAVENTNNQFEFWQQFFICSSTEADDNKAYFRCDCRRQESNQIFPYKDL